MRDNNEEKNSDITMEQVKPWKGYTLEEIRYQRVLTLARIEMEKVKLMSAYQNVMHGEKSHKAATGIMGRMFGALNYFDYGIIAYRLGRQVFKTVGRLRK